MNNNSPFLRRQSQLRRPPAMIGSATDCDFEGGVTDKITSLWHVKKCVDVETIQNQLKGCERTSHLNSMFSSFKTKSKFEGTQTR